ncbi:hypothetical protein KBD59_04640 [Candidatus Gracilibacteria bacterium]|nr:hypothetical protein [Candidatus Gracilibacteria bacterium]
MNDTISHRKHRAIVKAPHVELEEKVSCGTWCKSWKHPHGKQPHVHVITFSHVAH